MSTKIHIAVDNRGLPVRVLLTSGQAGDNPQPVPLLDGISVARIGPGRPRYRPGAVIADKARYAKRSAYCHAEPANAAIVRWLR